ncbi:MAG: hypothetical protein ABI565_13495, partial [Vicinamibacteria bacterium]
MDGRRVEVPARTVWMAGILGILAIGSFDYYSGTELRVFPLYYAPISLVAWYRGKWDAVAAAALGALSWFGSNFLAGQTYTRDGIWVVNTVVQWISFAVVGLLIGRLRDALLRE